MKQKVYNPTTLQDEWKDIGQARAKSYGTGDFQRERRIKISAQEKVLEKISTKSATGAKKYLKGIRKYQLRRYK